MRQYNKDKPKKWGFKVFALCASDTGLILNFEMYTGKPTIEKARSGRPRRFSTAEAMNSIIESIDGSFVDNTVDPDLFECLRDSFSIVEKVAVVSSQESCSESLHLFLNKASQETNNSDGESSTYYKLPDELEFTDTSILSATLVLNSTARTSKTF